MRSLYVFYPVTLIMLMKEGIRICDGGTKPQYGVV